MKMRIYFSERSDPMITDSVSGLNFLASRFDEFLAGDERRIFVAADTSGSPGPYSTLLAGIEMEKGKGPILVSRAANSRLHVTGSVENLNLWCSFFRFPPNAADGDHHHPENIDRPRYIDPRTLSVIVEVRDNET